MELGVALVGIDSTCQEVLDSDQQAKDKGEKAEAYAYPAHDILLGNNILIVENLCNLDKIKQVRGL